MESRRSQLRLAAVKHRDRHCPISPRFKLRAGLPATYSPACRCPLLPRNVLTVNPNSDWGAMKTWTGIYTLNRLLVYLAAYFG
jgi:hypothetical protein